MRLSAKVSTSKRTILIAHSLSPANNEPNPGNSAPQ
jgi:hypothetical protein